MKTGSNILLILVLLMMVSCDQKRTFDEYKSFSGEWHKDSVAVFDIPDIDTTGKYNLFVNLRANSAYPFNNIFLIVSMEHPGRLTQVDTLEYQMADAEGNMLGDGFSDVKESKLFYKENVRFKKGRYRMKVRHAVRESGKVDGVASLKGITEVGFRIESVE